MITPPEVKELLVLLARASRSLRWSPFRAKPDAESWVICLNGYEFVLSPTNDHWEAGVVTPVCGGYWDPSDWDYQEICSALTPRQLFHPLLEAVWKELKQRVGEDLWCWESSRNLREE